MAKLKLTKTAVEKLAPIEGEQLIFWDRDLTGFGIRVSPGGSRTFFYQGRLGGKVRKYTIGKFGPLTVEQARKEAKRIAGMLAQGKDPAPKTKRAGGSTFGDLMVAYADLLESRGRESVRAVRNQIKRDIETAFPRIWKKPAAEIDLDDCVKLVGTVRDAGSPRQADKLRSYIRTAFSEAINARGDVNMPRSMRAFDIRFNPARDMRKVEGSSGAKERALTLAEFRAYWRRINELPDPHRSLAIIHVLTGGQRQKQLSRVTLHDIDRDGPSMTIWDRKGRRKEPRRHEVPLLPETLEAIDRITGGGEYVFSANGGISPAHDLFLNDTVKRICADMEKAGELEKGPFTAGSIRATVETRLAAKPYRVGSDVLAHLLSHGMGGVQARHYQHHDFFDEKLEALEKLHRMVEGQPEPAAQVIEMRARA